MSALRRPFPTATLSAHASDIHRPYNACPGLGRYWTRDGSIRPAPLPRRLDASAAPSKGKVSP